MKIWQKLVSASALVLFVTLLCLYWPTESRNKMWHDRMRTKTLSDFHAQPSQYTDVVENFTSLFPADQPCGSGQRDAEHHMHKAIEIESDGRMTLIRDYEVQRHLNDAAMAQALNTSPNKIATLRTKLKAIQRSFVSQIGAEVAINTESKGSFGVFHLAQTCPQSAWYKDAPYPSNLAGYRELKVLEGGWYYFVEKR